MNISKAEMTKTILKEKLSFFNKIKVFLLSLLMLPIALGAHFVVTITAAFHIPTTLVDMLTYNEKSKVFHDRIRREKNVY